MRVNIFSKLFLLFAFLLMFTPAVDAFDLDFRVINNTVVDGSSVFYEIDVTNEGSSSQSFGLSTSDFRWILRSSPLSDYFSGFNVEGGETYTLDLEFTPRGDLPSGRYRIRTRINSRTTGEEEFLDIPVEVKSPDGNREYASTVVVSADVNGDDIIDPRETSTLRIEVDNRNPLNISDLDVEIRSEFINESFSAPLPPLDSWVEEINFDVDERTPPSIEDFTVVVRYEDESIGRTPMTFPVQVLEYSDIVRDTEEDDGFMSSRKIITLENQGNVDNSDEIRVETSFFSRLFTSASPDPQVIEEDGEKYLMWDIEIAPGGSTEIDVNVNYRPLVYVFIFIGAIIVLYYMLRSPILIKKTATAFDIHEEGISEIKILIHVRNRTPKNFVAFSVSEYIPKIASYMKSNTLGSIQPSKILNHEKKGTLLKWNFDAIEPFEERILIYKMKLNFAVLGRLNLPPTSVKFKDEAGASYTSKSNRLKILNSKKDEEKKR